MRSGNFGKSWERGKPKPQKHGRGRHRRVVGAHRARTTSSFPKTIWWRSQVYHLLYGRVREVVGQHVLIELGRGSHRRDVVRDLGHLCTVKHSAKHGLMMVSYSRTAPQPDQLVACLTTGNGWCLKQEINQALSETG